MLNWKYVLGIICVLSLVTTVPNVSAKADSNGAAIASGIIGAVGGAIIMNQIMQNQQRQGATQRAAKRRAKPKSDSSNQATNAKDPFAGEAAPAGYAKPVNNSK